VNVIFILIPLGLVLLGVAVAAFFWAVRSGQYDDLESPGWKILLDDDRAPPDVSSAGDILSDENRPAEKRSKTS
jgi:cbb3-type cytochrome oxidase maturation protein